MKKRTKSILNTVGIMLTLIGILLLATGSVQQTSFVEDFQIISDISFFLGIFLLGVLLIVVGAILILFQFLPKIK